MLASPKRAVLLMLLGPALGLAGPLPDTLPTEAGYFLPRDPIVLPLPDHLPDGAHLYLEVDQVDVTALVRLNTDTLTYRPPVPHQPGAHTVRLSAETPEGELLELGLWHIQIRENRHPVSAYWQVQGELSASWPAAHSSPAGTEPEAQREGSLALQGRVDGADWSAHADAGLLHHNLAAIMPEDRRLELSQAILSTQWHSQTLTAGDVQVEGHDLALTRLVRRGIRGQFGWAAGQIRLEPFVLSTPSLHGFDGGLGITRPDQRTAGSRLIWQPGAETGLPELSLTWLNSEGNPSGLTGSTPPLDASVLALSARLPVPDTGLVLQAGQARSRTDFDTEDDTLGSLTDNARSLAAIWQASPGQTGWQFAGLEWVTVEPDYYSPGYEGLPADQAGWRAWTDWADSGLHVQATLSDEHDNVNNDTWRPRLSTRRATLQMNIPMPARDAWARVWNHPVLSIDTQWSQQKHRNLPGGWTGWPVNQRARALDLTLTAAPQLWQWEAGFGFERFEAFTSATGYWRRHPHARVTLSPGGNWDLSVRAEWDHTREQNPLATRRSLTSGLTLNTQWPDRRITMQLAYELNRTLTGDASQDAYTHTASLAADWVLYPARPEQPALSLFSLGSYQDDRSISALTGDAWQLTLGIRIGATIGNWEDR